MAVRKSPSKGGKPDKLMRDALSLELHQEVEENGQLHKKLRLVARALVTKAIGGDVPAIREINERMDGKVPQGLVGVDNGPILIKQIERIIVESAANSDSEGISAAS